MEDQEKKAADPEYVPPLRTYRKLSDFLAQFIDEVLPGVNEHWLCRHRTCLHIGLAAEWINNHPNGQYRCPSCGEKYSPWVSQAGYVQANKVFLTCQDAMTKEIRAKAHNLDKEYKLVAGSSQDQPTMTPPPTTARSGACTPLSGQKRQARTFSTACAPSAWTSTPKWMQ